MWKETSLLCDRFVHIANSKTYVFSDSVLSLGSLSDKPVEAWKDRIKLVIGITHGEPMKFEWKNFPGFDYDWEFSLREFRRRTEFSK